MKLLNPYCLVLTVGLSMSLNEILGIFCGIFLLLGIHITVFIILVSICLYFVAIDYIVGIFNLSFFAKNLSFYLNVIKFFQLLYVLPVVVLLKRQQQRAVMKGVIIGAVLTALLNSAGYLRLVNFD